MAIKMNMEVMELMFYYWQATSEREKVGEAYLMTIADHENMQKIYTDEFKSESVRRALSAITNREIFSAESKKESRFLEQQHVGHGRLGPDGSDDGTTEGYEPG